MSGDCGKLQIQNLEQMSLMKSYLMLKKCQVYNFYTSELLRKNQQSRG